MIKESRSKQKISKVQITVQIILFLGSLILLIELYRPAYNSNKFALENFTSLGDDKVLIDVTNKQYIVLKTSFDTRTVDLDSTISRLVKENQYDIGQTDVNGRIAVELDGEYYNKPNLIVFVKDDHPRRLIGYIEILRQSESDLKNLYNFDKPGGYYVLGRTSLRLPKESHKNQTVSLAPKKGYLLPDLTNYYLSKQEGGGPGEIQESIALIKFIWDKPLSLGPSNNHVDEKLGPLERLELLRNNNWSAQCTAIRDIFRELALASHKITKVRNVDLFQYYPPFPDLITNSHSVIEIYSQQLDKWIMVDPYFATIFMQGQQYLNTEEINKLDEKERAKLKILNVSPNQSIDKLNTTLNIKDSYFIYFGAIFYGPIITTTPASITEPSGYFLNFMTSKVQSLVPK